MENNRKLSKKVSLNCMRPELQVDDEDVEGNPSLRDPVNNYYHGHR